MAFLFSLLVTQSTTGHKLLYKVSLMCVAGIFAMINDDLQQSEGVYIMLVGS